MAEKTTTSSSQTSSASSSSIKVDLMSSKKDTASSSTENKNDSTSSSSSTEEVSESSVTESSSVMIESTSVDQAQASSQVLADAGTVAVEETVPAEYVDYSTAYYTGEQVAYEATAPVYNTNSNYAALANGNTAGAVGSEAAAQMAAATGVSQATWEYIIARESNGDPNAYNPSGASGLFQTIPGWGSTATVQDQINAAINAYNAQGLAAWGMQ
ncbi:lytic transglycosylase domain-containing protein [Streptococcus sp. sy018]|nr:lytic transglycosylase domain-containing protein [Streptococcus sp. sy018]